MKILDKVKENQLLFLLLPALGLGGGSVIAKFGIFDPLVAPMHTMIYHQKISIHIDLGLNIEDAQDEAEEEMVEEGHWKRRGAE